MAAAFSGAADVEVAEREFVELGRGPREWLMRERIGEPYRRSRGWNLLFRGHC